MNPLFECFIISLIILNVVAITFESAVIPFIDTITAQGFAIPRLGGGMLLIRWLKNMNTGHLINM